MNKASVSLKWVKYNQELPSAWGFKKDIPEEWQCWATKVQFLFQEAWIVRDVNGLVYMKDGTWVPTVDFYLNTPGHVIGLRDIATANAHDWKNEWQAALSDRSLGQ